MLGTDRRRLHGDNVHMRACATGGQKRDDADKDKTPVPEKKLSTISRLESKYSDVLGRRRQREQQTTNAEPDDRDKTLEPDKPKFGVGLSRSATTVLSSSGAIAKKERTPYRLNRNYGDRKLGTATAATNTSASGSGTYRTRPDPSHVLQHSATAAHLPAKSGYYESPASRHKDSVYDAYHSRVSATSRYNEYDHYGLGGSGASASTYGYYDGRDKENAYKSKYEPSRLYAELNNNSGESFGRDRAAPRYQKAYRRTATTNFSNNYDDAPAAAPATSATATGYGRTNLSSSRYGTRKSSGASYQRSQTQQFFDSEKSSVLRDANSNGVAGYGGADDDADDSLKSEAMKEREARRKEIQSLIAKYAQIDDVYLQAIDKEAPSSAKTIAAPSVPRTSMAVDYSELGYANGSAATAAATLNGKPDADLLEPASSYGYPFGYAQQPLTGAASTRTSFLPLSKTQSVSAMSSVNRSRIPKTLPAFVRYSSIYV